MLSRTLSVALAASVAMALAVDTDCEGAPPSAPPAQAVEDAKAKLEGGRVAEAIRLFEKANKDTPGNADILFNLGCAYKKAQQYQKARTTFRSAWRAARGTPLAARANDELFSLPQKVLAPRPKRVVARIRGRRVAAAGLVRVKLIAFTASWAEPCKQLNAAIEKARSEWGDKVELVSVDVDDPKNEYLLEQYDVAPVPTVVFLDQEGKMVSFLIGYSGEAALNQRIEALTSGTKAPSSAG